MKFIDQTDTKKGTGDCMRATVASILNLDSLEQVPHFVLFKDGMWFIVYKNFFRSFGYEWEGVSNNPDDLKKENGFSGGHFLASVPSKTNEGVSHSVIIDLQGKVIHDPNPNKLWQNQLLDFSNPEITFDIFSWSST